MMASIKKHTSTRLAPFVLDTTGNVLVPGTQQAQAHADAGTLNRREPDGGAQAEHPQRQRTPIAAKVLVEAVAVAGGTPSDVGGHQPNRETVRPCVGEIENGKNTPATCEQCKQ